MSGAATYLYAVVRTDTAPAWKKKAPPGLAGMSRPRFVDVGDDLHLLVADAPLTLYAASAIDAELRNLDWVGARAAEHEAVLEHATALGTCVPMKLFTLFSSEDRAVAHVAKMKKALAKVTARLEGCEEWGLRILLDEKRARTKRRTEVAGAKKVSGTSFLQRKKALDDERRLATTRGAAEADALFASLSKLARKALRRPAPNRDLAQRVFLDAAFLVPRADVKRLKAAVTEVAKVLVAEGFDISLSGPWPAYSFVS